MRIDQKSIYGVVIITVLFAGCLSFWIWRSPNLEFRERGSPRGFRELVLEAEFWDLIQFWDCHQMFPV